MPLDDHEIFKSMLERLESIDAKFNKLDKNLAVLSPVITEQGRRISKVEDLAEVLKEDVNSLASIQRSMRDQFKLAASAVCIASPIISVLASKLVG